MTSGRDLDAELDRRIHDAETARINALAAARQRAAEALEAETADETLIAAEAQALYNVLTNSADKEKELARRTRVGAWLGRTAHRMSGHPLIDIDIHAREREGLAIGRDTHIDLVSPVFGAVPYFHEGRKRTMGFQLVVEGRRDYAEAWIGGLGAQPYADEYRKSLSIQRVSIDEEEDVRAAERLYDIRLTPTKTPIYAEANPEVAEREHRAWEEVMTTFQDDDTEEDASKKLLRAMGTEAGSIVLAREEPEVIGYTDIPAGTVTAHTGEPPDDAMLMTFGLLRQARVEFDI